MAPGAAVEPIEAAPERLSVRTFLTLGDDGIGPALVRAGATYGDAVRIHSMVRDAGASPTAGTSVELVLGRKQGGTSPGRPHHLSRRDRYKDRHRARRWRAGIAAHCGGGKYETDADAWTRRGRALLGAAQCRCIARDRRGISQGAGAGDRRRRDFAERPVRPGRRQPPRRRWAGAERACYSMPRSTGRWAVTCRLVRWTAGGKPDLDQCRDDRRSPCDDNAMAWPVNAPITSRFGLRASPDPALRPDASRYRFRRTMGYPDPCRR